jgi:hypothetical protein
MAAADGWLETFDAFGFLMAQLRPLFFTSAVRCPLSCPL